jgi:DNA polymerase-3 subunit epsilon
MSKQILFIDTETTGKADFRSQPDAPHQPRMVQLGAILADEAGKVLAELNVIIQPDGWTIPAEAAAVHGISTEQAEAAGVSVSVALDLLEALHHKAGVIVAHNIDFDRLVIDGEYLRSGFDIPDHAEPFCTMHAMTGVCKLPGRYGNYKWPTLTEAHQHLFGAGVEGAHDAMADVRACMRIYFELMKRRAAEPVPAE